MAGATPGGELAVMIEPVLESMGYELVDIEFGAGGLLRVVIDIADGMRHVQVEDCEKVSHQLGRLFMVENVDYDRLEISSPGLDRPLKKQRDFIRFAGEKVSLRMREPIEGRRHFTGILQRETAAASEPGATAADRWVLFWTDEPPAVAGRKPGKGGVKGAFKGSRSGKSGKGVAKAAVAARGGKMMPPGDAEVQPQGQRLEFSLDQIEKARLVPKLVF